MVVHPPARDIPRITLAVLSIAGMVVAGGWVMLPFIAALVWATMIVIATWPILLWLQARLGGRRGPAVAILVVVLLAAFIVPAWLGIAAIAENAKGVAQSIRTIVAEGLPPPPEWVARVPLVGARLVEGWSKMAGHPESVAARIAPHVDDVLRWVAARAGDVGSTVVQFLLTVAISGVLYRSGEKASTGVLRFLRRLGGPEGEKAGILAAKAVRAVALGIIVTALLQTVVSGGALAIVGVPHAAALTAVVFVSSIAQVGPVLVMLPATIWLYGSGATARGTVLLVFTVVTATMDNVIRPVLIKKGADLPMLLILPGVIGGLIGFGVVGIFIGPVLLAVIWRLLAAWVAQVNGVAGSATS